MQQQCVAPQMARRSSMRYVASPKSALGIRPGAMASLVWALLLVSCGSDKGAQPSSSPAPNSSTVVASTESSPTTTTTAAVRPANFQGPIFVSCADSNSSGSSFAVVEKLNLQTGEFLTVAQYDPTEANGVCETSGINQENFGGQVRRTLFSRDFQKFSSSRNSNVGYYDAALKKYVNVTEIVSPANGDFDAEPVHRGGYFTDDDLFVFYDWRAKNLKFFDTHSQQIVRESDHVPNSWWFIKAVFNPEGDPDPEFWPPSFKTCDNGVWVVDDKRYIVVDRYASNGRQYSLGTIPSERTGYCVPDNLHAITPSSNGLFGIASDRGGSTIIFLVAGKDGSTKLYKANAQNPEQPSVVPVKSPLGGEGGVEIIGWE